MPANQARRLDPSRHIHYATAAIVAVIGAIAPACAPAESEQEPIATTTEAATAFPFCVDVVRGGFGTVADAQIAEWSSSTNFGGASTMYVGWFTLGTSRRGLVRFDLSFLPPGSTIQGATMRLRRNGTAVGGIDVRRVTAPWAENTVTYQSFANAFHPAVLASAPSNTTYSSFDLTALAQSWADGAPNYGVFLAPTPGLTGTTFRTSEFGDGLSRPTLHICFTPPPPPACQQVVCDPITKICSNVPVTDGTACDDGDACTQVDTCVAGSCTGADPVQCAAADACHLPGACDPATGTCSNPIAADGTCNVVFVTSAAYDGNLGGLAGADATCQAHAETAGVRGSFKAWLSDDAISAGDRLYHAATPYVLVDGTVVANDWAELASNFLAHPIDRTELGDSPTVFDTGCGPFAGVFTGTGAPNAFSVAGQNCNGWSTADGAVNALIGHALEANSHWTNLCSFQPCSTPTPLYCIEQPPRVFVTSTRYDGNLGGLAGADAKCQARADAAGLAGTFKAWLSDDAISAGDRLHHSALPYVLVDGTLVADDWNHLASNFLAHAIDQNELGGSPAVLDTGCGPFAGVFTGTGAPNAFSVLGQNCDGWSTADGAVNALIGHALEANSHWTNLCSFQPCNTPTPLYCVEQR
jgi:uncharacterized protein DUF1554